MHKWFHKHVAGPHHLLLGLLVNTIEHCDNVAAGNVVPGLNAGAWVSLLLAALVALVPPGEVHILALLARPVTRPSHREIQFSPRTEIQFSPRLETGP